jgi:CheY-like chemotaxis protein
MTPKVSPSGLPVVVRRLQEIVPTMPLTAFRSPRGAPRVLVVEDDPFLREAICEVLESEGLETTASSNGREALERLERDPIASLIVLDLAMPTMSGWELREKLRERPDLDRIPVLVLSALVEDGVDRPAGRAEYHLGKPFNAEMLLACVRRAIGDSREMPANRIYENLTLRVSSEERFVEFRTDEEDRVPLFRLAAVRFEDRVLRLARSGGVRANLGPAEPDGLRLLTLSHAWGGGEIARQRELVPLAGEA